MPQRSRAPAVAVLVACAAAIALAACKWRYWRDIDAAPLPATRGDAVGLPHAHGHGVRTPAHEANYLTREMAFVLARKHARGCGLAMVLIALLPVRACCSAGGRALQATACIVAGAASALAGAFVERWLFFAEARHMVTLYY